MKILEQLESAIKSSDPVTRTLPVLKCITNAFPFPDLHVYVKDPKLVKLLLIIQPLLPEAIDMILGQLLDIFKGSQEWIKGCCKSIEEFAILKQPKFYAIEYFEQVLYQASLLGVELDDICYGFIIFLKHAESEKMVLHIMNKIEAVKEEFGFAIRSLNQFNELVESTVLQLYQEESNKNTDEQHFRSVAIGLQESQNRKTLRHQNTVSSPSMRSPAVSRQRTESFGSLDDEVNDLMNLEEILIQDKPRIDSDQAEYFKSNERLQNLIYFITDPYASQPSLIFDTDALADQVIGFDEINYKRFRNIKIDKLFTIRSYKALLFLTDLHNYKLLLESNSHLTQFIFRSVSGFLQNAQSIGNITHMVALIQFYLKNDTKDTVYYFLYCSLPFQFLDYIYNPYVFDILMRFIDPQNLRIPQQLRDEIWLFLNSQGFIPYLINRIINKDYMGVNRKEFHVSKEGFNILKRIYDMKIIGEENASDQHTYNLSSNLDQYLGPLMPGKTTQWNLIKRKTRQLHAAQSQTYQRRHSGHGLTGKFNKIILAENIQISELNGSGRDIDRLKDIVTYYQDNQIEGEDPPTPILGQTPNSEKEIKKTTLHRNHLSEQLYSTDFLSNKQEMKTSGITKSTIMENKSLDMKFPSLKQSAKLGNPLSSRITRQSSKQSQELVFKKKKSLKIDSVEDMSTTFKKLNNPITSPTSASKVHLFYPNSDTSVIDRIMKEELEEYIHLNNEQVSLIHSQFLKCIIESYKSVPYRYGSQTSCFLQLIDEKFTLFEKLFHHYTLKIIEQDNGSALECGYIIIDVLKKLNQCNNLFEQCNKLYRQQIPRLCRDIVLLHKRQKFPEQINLQSYTVNAIGIQKIMMFEILKLMICNIRVKYSNIFLKLNETAMHVLILEFHSSFHNAIYSRIFLELVRHLFVYASDKQLLSVVFKVNLIESIHAAYKNTVINRVVIKDWNTEQYIYYLSQLSALIVNAFDLREDLKTLRQSVIRLQSYQKLKEFVQLCQCKFDTNLYTQNLVAAEQQLAKIRS